MKDPIKLYKGLIVRLLEEINEQGELQIIEGGSEDKPTTLKHDRTTTLRNYLSGWKTINEIFQDTSNQPDIKSIRNSL